MIVGGRVIPTIIKDTIKEMIDLVLEKIVIFERIMEEEEIMPMEGTFMVNEEEETTDFKGRVEREMAEDLGQTK